MDLYSLDGTFDSLVDATAEDLDCCCAACCPCQSPQWYVENYPALTAQIIAPGCPFDGNEYTLLVGQSGGLVFGACAATVGTDDTVPATLMCGGIDALIQIGICIDCDLSGSCERYEIRVRSNSSYCEVSAGTVTVVPNNTVCNCVDFTVAGFEIKRNTTIPFPGPECDCCGEFSIRFYHNTCP